jgi:DNA-binding transcriptional LysR family regulator
MFDWDDLRVFLAVAEGGSTHAAARALGINQSTVQRRIAALEARLGQALYLREPHGYRLTEFARTLLPQARGMADTAAEIARRAEAHANLATGTIHLTCPEPLVERLNSSDLLTGFHAAYPGLTVEIVMSDRYLDLAKGEADVALRSGEPEDETLVGRRVGESVWAVYASLAYVARHGRPASEADLRNHLLVGFDKGLARHRSAVWLAEVAPDATVVVRGNSVLGILHSVKSGIGIAPLPTTLARGDPGLVEVLPPVASLERGWYLLTRADLRQTRRVAAFFDFVTSNLALLRPVLMG